MQIVTSQKWSKSVRLSLKEEGKEIARAFLYLINNDLHAQPYALLEDVFVQEEFRGQGNGVKIVQAAIEEARKQGCYKLIGTSRHSREKVHLFYKKLGFYEQGLEFRMDFWV